MAVRGFPLQSRENAEMEFEQEDTWVGWGVLDANDLPIYERGPYLTTNSPTARNAHGMPSHIYLVSMFHTTKGPEGPVTAFDEADRQIWNCLLFKPVFP